jgi:hypothetical protein
MVGMLCAALAPKVGMLSVAPRLIVGIEAELFGGDTDCVTPASVSPASSG